MTAAQFYGKDGVKLLLGRDFPWDEKCELPLELAEGD